MISDNYSIENFCKDLLKKRFSNNPLKTSVSVSKDKLNFSCPFCGDSKFDSNKKRGNLYLNTSTYKCYNDGCGIQLSIHKFVRILGLKYGLYLPELNKKPEFSITYKDQKKGFLFEFLLNNKLNKKLININHLAMQFGLIPITKLDYSTNLGSYIKSRCLNQSSSFNNSCYYDTKLDKIYICNIDLKSNKLIGLAIRYINSNFGLKYNIKNYSELIKSTVVDNVFDNKFIKKLDLLNNYFNLLNIKFNESILVTEGQFDSMFLNNCIATTGVAKIDTLLLNFSKNQIKIIFDNDKAGKSSSIKLLKSGYTVFLWSQLIQSLKKKYPFKVKEIKKIKDINDLYCFLFDLENISISDFNQLINNYFSNNPFDLIMI